MIDAIVIGGAFAGLSAALQLARASRSVLVVDAGQPRNRTSPAAHGVPGWDGVPPADILDRFRADLAGYPTVGILRDRVNGISGRIDAFQVTLDQSDQVEARRIILAHGVRDILPDLPGLSEAWGRTVLHCPYCHGYELNRGRIGVIATGPMSVHQAQLLPEWGEITFLTNGKVALDDDARADLLLRGVTVEEAPIDRLAGHADVVLADGRILPFAGLFTATQTSPASPLAEALGCAMMETPMGRQVQTEASKETTVPGAYACGDVARMPHSVSLAVGDGAWAGANIHRSLVFG